MIAFKNKIRNFCVNNFFPKHINFWTDKTIMFHLLMSFILLLGSIFLTYYARIYANNHAGYVVADLLLDNLPVVDVSIFFFQGAFIFILALIGLLMYEPKYIPFTLEATAIFFSIRSFFMIMTHLSAPSIEYYNYIQHDHHVKEILFTLTSGNDMFFAGHAGYPFLLALVFWKIPYVRYLFLLCSLIGAVIVILGHLHYSIDVFSSFFIAFGIYEISKFFFKKEFKLTI